MRLIFHEMLTIAIKHGALADDRGLITVNWFLDGALTLARKVRQSSRKQNNA
jgi:two-component sensor histidine kinase